MVAKKSSYISVDKNPFIEGVIFSSDISKEKKHYLYIHYRMDKLEAFYVGIGTKYRKKDYDRAFDYKKRSNFWKRVVNKTKYKVFIINESDDYKEIKDKEINYIAVLGKRKDKKGELVNLTDGGEGKLGCKVEWTKEMRAKIGEANRKRVIKESTREKHRENIKTRSFFKKKKI